MAATQGRDVSRWLCNAGHAPAGRPADLGYYVGYKICERYYRAIALRDPGALIEASGYAAQFE